MFGWEGEGEVTFCRGYSVFRWVLGVIVVFVCVGVGSVARFGNWGIAGYSVLFGFV